jgi:DNA-binding NarL/FixJ family response regulator
MTTRVILAVEPQMLRGLLEDAIAAQPDIDVVGEANGLVELLLAVRATGANVVICTWPDAGEVPGICTHLLSENPELRIIGIAAEGENAWACRQVLMATPFSLAGADDLLEQIRQGGDDFSVIMAASEGSGVSRESLKIAPSSDLNGSQQNADWLPAIIRNTNLN